MKIDANLARAVKAVVKTHNASLKSWEEKARVTKAAIQVVVAKRHNRTRVANAQSRLKALNAERDKLFKVFDQLGIDTDCKRIADEERFIQAGGILPTKELAWDETKILAELATATEAEGQKILKARGIVWS